MAIVMFRRPKLAKQFCDAVQGEGLLDARSGLFLTARRRVGKSTFLKEDLVPEAQKRGWATVYVDLWEDKSQDPAVLLADQIKRAIVAEEGFILKATRKAKLSKVSVLGSLTIDLDKAGFPEGMSLKDALVLLYETVKKPIMLIVDEAQHALTTNAGSNAMFALKAARDHMNTSDAAPKLMLVMTGSNRDKLTHLVINRKQPFFGSQVSPFPLLGKDFTDMLTATINQQLAENNQLNHDDVFSAFQLIGHRPEILLTIIGRIVLQGDAPCLSQLIHDDAKIWHETIWGEYESTYEALTPLQQAILIVMATEGANFSPFVESAFSSYRKLTGETDFSNSTIQAALESLREREIVWKESRGLYAVEDDGFATWLKKLAVTQSTEITTLPMEE